MSENDQLLTTEELATFLRVPTQTVRYWRHTGEGPRGYRVGKYVRYRAADVDAWLTSRGGAPAA